MFRSLVVMLLLLTAGCASVDVRRSEIPGQCNLNELGMPGNPETCAKAAVETAPNFKIAYVEFTDQGWLYKRDQLDKALDLLRASPDEDLQVVLFVHGWKHSAKWDDGNVQHFRAVIVPSFARHNPKARTVGIYIGWRGASLEVPSVIQNVTFYDRKATADHVARGSVRELLSNVRAIKHSNAGTKREVTVTAIGHSFGGLILFNSLAGPLLDALVDANNHATTVARTVTPVFDRVVLLNPAFEASRFEPLFQVAKDKLNPDGSGWHYGATQQPIFISITSEADAATRLAFPLGRIVNSFFEHEGLTDQDDLKAEYADRLEKRANTHTIGHMLRYRTHTLALAPGDTGKKDQAAIVCTAVQNPLIGEPTRFPLWNIYTNKDVIADHNAIYQDNLWNFIAEISDRKRRVSDICR